jgi:hypothetical protein
MSVCASGVRIVCKKNTCDFILVWAEKCPTSSGGGEFYIMLHRSACSRGYKQTWERKEFPSLKAWVEKVGVCDSAGDLTRSRKVICLRLVWYCYGGYSFSLQVSGLGCAVLEWSLHASFIVLMKCRVTWCRRVAWPFLGASGEPYPVATWPVLWRYDVDTFGTAAMC